MTSFSPPVSHGVPHGTSCPPPTYQEWTAAHGIADPNRRRVALALLHDRLVASSMRPWAARLYLKRHVLGWLARWSLMIPMALWVTPWMWVMIVGIPALGLWEAWRRADHE